jgi:hypothetical protein
VPSEPKPDGDISGSVDYPTTAGAWYIPNLPSSTARAIALPPRVHHDDYRMVKMVLAVAIVVTAAFLRCGGVPSIDASSVSVRNRSPAPPATEKILQTEWDRIASHDGAACRKRLDEMGVRFQAMPDRSEPDVRGCGIPHGVIVTRGPSGIVYAPPLTIDCSLALELPLIENAAQQQAKQHLGVSIKKITSFGTYSCRNVRGGSRERLSEHALGNAIDFGAFAPARGPVISVQRNYRPIDGPADPPSRFLHGLFAALDASDGFTHVIGPATRADHQDHIHVDRGAVWWQVAPARLPL